MKQNENYSVPKCEIVLVSETNNLMADSSFNGQHNPAQPGGTHGDAKQTPSWMSGYEEDTPAWNTNRE